MLHIKTVYFDKFGIVLLIFSIVFSFFYSLGYTLDGSNYDYMFYMHLTDEGNYKENPLFAGTLFFYKPLSLIFGRSYWIWQRFHWGLNLLTICIPYVILMNKEQRRMYAFVQALAVLFFCLHRCGCEPPRLVLLFVITAVCLFVKYTRSQNLWIVCGISVLLALIAYVRFPSMFVYPMFVIAFFLTAEKKKDVFVMTILPVVIFSLLVTITNGSIFEYINDLKNNISNTSTLSPSHSISAIFMSEVDSIKELIYFSGISMLPFLLLLWKRKTLGWWIFSAMVTLLVLNIIRCNPISRWACAIAVVLSIFYVIENKGSRVSIAKALLIVFIPMITSVGSNCGFNNDYVSVTFVPYIVANMQYVDFKRSQFSLQDFKVPLEKGLLFPVFVIVVITLYGSNLNVKLKYVRSSFFDRGKVSIVNAKMLSSNVDYIYIGEKYITKYLEAEKDYNILSKGNREVIFWGMDAHLMSFVNDKWPVTKLWKISSKEDDKAAMYDLEKYVKDNKPIVIDMEQENNTDNMLISMGYHRVKKEYYSIYK